MRPKVVIAILLLATGLLTVIILASKALRLQTTSSFDENKAVSVAPTHPDKTVNIPVVISPPGFSAPTVAVVTNDPAAHERYVRQRIRELNDLAMNNDIKSRDAILAEVATNSDKRIRAAALEAAIQFDDRSVVPPLQQIADQIQDPEEKSNILAAIDYINLPSLTEYLDANPSQSTNIGLRMIPPRSTHTTPAPGSQSAPGGQ